jgi:hypothetical protein
MVDTLLLHFGFFGTYNTSMKNNKKTLINLISYVVVFAFCLTGVVWMLCTCQNHQENFAAIFCFYTNDSNILAVISSFLMVVFFTISLFKKDIKLPHWLGLLNLMSMLGVLLTFLVVVCVLLPMDGGGMFGDEFIFLHLLSPIAYVLVFAFLNKDYRYVWTDSFYTIIPVLLYGIVILSLVGTGKIEAPYPFLSFDDPLILVVSVLGILIGTWLLGLLFIWLSNGLGNLINGRNVDEAKDSNPEAPEAKDEGNNDVRTYHISRKPFSKEWQVKLANGEKAIKLFSTQKEAIAYAKDLVDKNGGSIRIHSMKGSLRKE